MKERWFVYDYNGDGLTLHKTSEDAKITAEENMQEALNEVGADCFVTGNEEVLWGELVIKGRAKTMDGVTAMVDE